MGITYNIYYCPELGKPKEICGAQNSDRNIENLHLS